MLQRRRKCDPRRIHGRRQPRRTTRRRTRRPPLQGPPPDAETAGLTVGALAAQRRNLFTGGFTTPVLALSAESVEHNLALLETYSERHGLAFAPHGKTSMSPQLFARQLAYGAWGITAAVPHQARVYRAYGIQRIFLANEVVDPAALRWLAHELDTDPDFRFICYVDSVRGVELMDDALQGTGRPSMSSSSSAQATEPAPEPEVKPTAPPSPTPWPPPKPSASSASPATRARSPGPTATGYAPGCAASPRWPPTSTSPAASPPPRRS